LRASGARLAGIWRSLNHERAKRDLTTTGPVRLVRFEDGRLALFDDQTGYRVELMGFGVDNNGAVVNPGDEVVVHGKPILAAYGEVIVEERVATITRATLLERLWTRATGDFEFMELCEFAFSEEVYA